MSSKVPQELSRQMTHFTYSKKKPQEIHLEYDR